jgi:hypothetical protein
VASFVLRPVLTVKQCLVGFAAMHKTDTPTSASLFWQWQHAVEQQPTWKNDLAPHGSPSFASRAPCEANAPRFDMQLLQRTCIHSAQPFSIEQPHLGHQGLSLCRYLSFIRRDTNAAHDQLFGAFQASRARAGPRLTSILP